MSEKLHIVEGDPRLCPATSSADNGKVLKVDNGEPSWKDDGVSSKADKVSSATQGNFASLTSEGNLADSRTKASDFADASHRHPQSDVTGLDAALAAKITNPPDGVPGNVLKKTEDGVEWGTGGSGGTSDYNDLDNKPSIAGTTLSGNKTLADLDIRGRKDLTVYQVVITPWSDGTREYSYDATSENRWRYAGGFPMLQFVPPSRPGGSGGWRYYLTATVPYPGVSGDGHELSLTFTRSGYPDVTVTRSSESTVDTSGTIAKVSDIKTRTSQLTNDSGFLTSGDNVQFTTYRVTTLADADDSHYPTAKAVGDAVSLKQDKPASGQAAGKFLKASSASEVVWADPPEPENYVKSILVDGRTMRWLPETGVASSVDLGVPGSCVTETFQTVPDHGHIPTEKLVKDTIDAVDGRFGKDALPSGAEEWSQLKDYNPGDMCWLGSVLWMATFATGPGTAPNPGASEPSPDNAHWAKVEKPSDFAVLKYGQSKIIVSDKTVSSTFLSLENDLLKIRDADDGTTGSYNELSMKVYPNAVYFKAYYKNGSTVRSATLDKTGVHTTSSTSANSETEVTYGPDGIIVGTYSVTDGVRAASATQSTTIGISHGSIELSSVILTDTGAGRANDKYRLSVVNGELTIAKV